MKVIKHIKKGNICFVSHIDSMRVLQRTLVRANIKVKLSEGFNPHPLTFTSHPLPLGVASEEEFFVLSNEDMTASEVLDSFNKSVPDGMKGVACYDCVKNPNFAKNVNYCEYFVNSKELLPLKAEIESLANKSEWIITFPFKNTVKEQNISPLIYNLEVVEDGIKMILSAGNPNLRPDRLTNALNEKFALKIGANDITRTKQLIINDNKILTAEEFLQEFIK